MRYLKTEHPFGHRGGLFFLILIFLSLNLHAGEPYLSSEEAHSRVEKSELILIDIRTPGEWRHTGVALHAQTISMHRPGFMEKILAAVDGDKTKPIALICARGGRSNRMQATLREAGFTNVYDVSEGMLGTFLTEGWVDKKLPLRPYKG